MVSIKGLNKADVLAALYNAARPQGMGFLQYNAKPMTREEAEAILQRTNYFDYLKGRVMKITLHGDEFNEWAYDRDNGAGCAASVIEQLRQTSDVNSAGIEIRHHLGVAEAAKEAENNIRPTTFEDGIVTLGLPNSVGDAIKRAIGE